MGGRRSDLCRDRRYELAGDELTDEMALGTDPEQTLSDTLGQSTVKTRFHKADWQSFDPASLDYPPCLGIRIQIDSEGGLALFHTVHTEQFHGDMPETSDATVLTTPSVSFTNFMSCSEEFEPRARRARSFLAARDWQGFKSRSNRHDYTRHTRLASLVGDAERK